MGPLNSYLHFPRIPRLWDSGIEFADLILPGPDHLIWLLWGVCRTNVLIIIGWGQGSCQCGSDINLTAGGEGWTRIPCQPGVIVTVAGPLAKIQCAFVGTKVLIGIGYVSTRYSFHPHTRPAKIPVPSPRAFIDVPFTQMLCWSDEGKAYSWHRFFGNAHLLKSSKLQSMMCPNR